ncbi:glycosyltransferase [Clostridium formicaceticum]|uniref:Photosystem I assembly protein Ycf3 n=1 Tax=Clostridium formicaceticum TaxID=1497 RepID=A0AAC9RKC4_9CLOT|nr:glycosyltransferase [Clostridium formicaceticum]AOY78153.1 hypothetical protein BJL90_21180 [Clostridium formicaceticum]ARE88806.1 photosystem I assembly protein Ycf3 [Clostridium formicaceticum]
MTKAKGLSLCIITKDDEKHLTRCLENMEAVADEIMIINIGSRDLMMKVELKTDVTVYKMQEKSSYREAKNFCLDRAKGRWILFLQANEVIPVEQGKKMRLLLDNPNVEGYLLYVDHPLQKHRISSPVASLRLLRNRKEYRYQHQIFERIPDEVLSNIKDAGIRIFQQANTISSDTILFLLEEELENHPEDSYLQYIYGIELLNQQRYQESIGYLQKARKNVNLDYLFAPHLYKCLSWGLILLKRDKEALEVLEEGIKTFPFYTDLLVLRGELRRKFQQYTEAIQDLERSLKLKEKSNAIVPRPEINASTILQMLGEAHEEVLNDQEALTCYQQAYQLNKANQKLLHKIGELAKKLGATEVLENLRNITGELEGKEDQYMKLAEAWIEGSQQEAIEKIFLSMKNKQKQLVLKQKIIEQLLRSEEIEAAEKFMKLGELQPLGLLEYVMWSKSFTKKLEAQIHQWNMSLVTTETSLFQVPTKPSKALIAFYHHLIKSNGKRSEDPLTEVTCAKVHREIGCFYEKIERKQEALSAYLRALQWNPIDDLVQEKVMRIFHHNPNEFDVFLKREAWFLEGDWFQHKKTFICYMQGLIHFKNRQFEETVTSFLKIEKKETSYPIALAYIISSLWLMGKETEAEGWLKKVSKSVGVLSLFSHICKSYALDTLNEGHQQYPYSQLILLEKQRLDNSNYISCNKTFTT